MNPIERILTALREHGHEPRKAGAGWCCRCPAHDDRNPSLSIHAGDDGRALVNCHAGCTVDAVCGSIGLRAADLFTPDPSRRTGHTPRTRPSVTVTTTPRTPARNAGIGDGDAKTFPTARDAVAELERRHGPRSTTWTYTNAAGDPVGLVVRWNTPTGKDVRPVSRKADGSGWIIGGMPTPRPLYALPDLLATPAGSRVFIVEGEKAADAARAVGLVATTSPHGSKSAGKADWSPVAGREVVILPDHDDAGERYADDVARLATAAGAKSVRVVRLVELWAGMPEGGDMADLVEHRGGDIDPIRADVEALADKTEPEAVTAELMSLAFKPFPLDALPGVLGRFVATTAKRMGGDPVFVLQPALAALAGAVGRAVAVVVSRGWSEPCAVWCAIAAPPSSMKSPGRRAATLPTYKAQSAADREYAEALTAYEAAVFRFDAAQADAKRAARAGDAVADPPVKPRKPPRPQWIVRDATREALVQVVHQNPRGLFSDQDELAGMLGAFGAYSKASTNAAEPDAAFYKSAWSAETFIENRKGDGGTYVRIEPLLSIYGAIQPDALGPVLGRQRIADGSASRFLWALPPDAPARFPVEQTNESDTDDDAYARVHRVLCAIPMGRDAEGEPQPSYLGLTREAQAIGREWVNRNADRIVAESDPALRAAFGKHKGYLFRFAMLFHLIGMTESGAIDETGNGDLGTVGVDSMRRAVAVMDWYQREARRVYAILSESDDDREIRRLVEWIDRKGGTVTARDLTHGVRAYRGDPDAAERALSALVEAGIGRWEADAHGPKGGRPAQRFRLVSTVTVTETPTNAGKDVGCGDGDTGDTATDAGDGWGEL